MAARMLYLHALSPLHSGTGHSADVIDLPVAREKATNWPYLPGSSLKGVLRDAAVRAGAEERTLKAAFGTVDAANGSGNAGGLWFADGRLLAFPVRSLAGSFAWITCPLALRRWQRDHTSAGLAEPAVPAASTAPVPAPGATDGRTRPVIRLGQGADDLVLGNAVYLEDLDFGFGHSAEVAALATAIAKAVFDDQAWRDFFAARFGIVSDDLFGFLTETATEVIARVRLDETTKTVAQGGLWYEEAVPAEAIFACPVITAPVANDDHETELLDTAGSGLGSVLQIGGHASIGRGIVRARLA